MPAKKYFNHKCAIEGCSKYAEENWMCPMHAQRVRRYGDPHYVTPEQRRRELSRIAQLENWSIVKPTTYRKYLGRHHHRVVAEQKIGRALRRGEIVHHMDGDRHNNDPSNLQIITQSEHINLHRRAMERARSKR